jgi:hypothetical protein
MDARVDGKMKPRSQQEVPDKAGIRVKLGEGRKHATFYAIQLKPAPIHHIFVGLPFGRNQAGGLSHYAGASGVNPGPDRTSNHSPFPGETKIDAYL